MPYKSDAQRKAVHAKKNYYMIHTDHGVSGGASNVFTTNKVLKNEYDIEQFALKHNFAERPIDSAEKISKKDYDDFNS